MWPMFVLLGVVDGVVGHALPVVGHSESVVGGVVVALVLNLIAVAVVARPVGALLRRRRRDLPADIARNYAGTVCVILVTAGFVALGALNHSSIARDDATMRDADARAAAYIGDHAPAPFRADASHLDTVVIESGSVYRACVANPARTRDYCVVVNEAKRSVVPDGSESNETLSRGVD
jgi:hypothetical protein